jgi:hypothetical protein
LCGRALVSGTVKRESDCLVERHHGSDSKFVLWESVDFV